MTSPEKILELETLLKPLYGQNKEKLLFHGWHHISFVRAKAVLFAQKMNRDGFMVESAAMVHDLNYLVLPNSEPAKGKSLREEILAQSGYTQEEILKIENIIIESDIATRSENISDEGKILSDADTLFKALPITPVLFSGKYITENKVSIAELADKILKEQTPLLENGVYFYTDFAKQNYLKWAKTNLELWQNIKECLTDTDIQDLLEG